MPAPSFIGAATGVTTATLPAHQAGDLILVFAYRDGLATAPSLPTGYTNIQAPAGSTNAARIGFRRALGSSETVGTWTNATSVIAMVFRGVDPVTAIGVSASTTGSSTTISYPNAGTMNFADGDSTVVRAAGHRSTNVAIETLPAGYTLAATVADATDEAAAFYRVGETSAALVTTAVGGTASGFAAVTVEIRGLKPRVGTFDQTIDDTLTAVGDNGGFVSGDASNIIDDGDFFANGVVFNRFLTPQLISVTTVASGENGVHPGGSDPMSVYFGTATTSSGYDTIIDDTSLFIYPSYAVEISSPRGIAKPGTHVISPPIPADTALFVMHFTNVASIEHDNGSEIPREGGTTFRYPVREARPGFIVAASDAAGAAQLPGGNTFVLPNGLKYHWTPVTLGAVANLTAGAASNVSNGGFAANSHTRVLYLNPAQKNLGALFGDEDLSIISNNEPLRDANGLVDGLIEDVGGVMNGVVYDRTAVPSYPNLFLGQTGAPINTSYRNRYVLYFLSAGAGYSAPLLGFNPTAPLELSSPYTVITDDFGDFSIPAPAGANVIAIILDNATTNTTFNVDAGVGVTEWQQPPYGGWNLTVGVASANVPSTPNAYGTSTGTRADGSFYFVGQIGYEPSIISGYAVGTGTTTPVNLDSMTILLNPGNKVLGSLFADEDITISATNVSPFDRQGTLDQTINDQTISSAGRVQVRGSVDQTLDDNLTAVAGPRPIVGTATLTDAVEAISAAGTVPVRGALSATIDEALITSGTVPALGSLSATIDEALATTGRVPAVGALSAQIDEAFSATGGQLVKGDASIAIDDGDAYSFSGTVPIRATATPTIDEQLAATGVSFIVGALSATVDEVLATAGRVAAVGSLSGQVDEALVATAAIITNASATMAIDDGDGYSISGVLPIRASASPIIDEALTASGAVAIVGALDVTVDDALAAQAALLIRADADIDAGDIDLVADGGAPPLSGYVTVTIDEALEFAAESDIAGTAFVVVDELLFTAGAVAIVGAGAGQIEEEITASGSVPALGTLTDTLIDDGFAAGVAYVQAYGDLIEDGTASLAAGRVSVSGSADLAFEDEALIIARAPALGSVIATIEDVSEADADLLVDGRALGNIIDTAEISGIVPMRGSLSGVIVDVGSATARASASATVAANDGDDLLSAAGLLRVRGTSTVTVEDLIEASAATQIEGQLVGADEIELAASSTHTVFAELAGFIPEGFSGHGTVSVSGAAAGTVEDGVAARGSLTARSALSQLIEDGMALSAGTVRVAAYFDGVVEDASAAAGRAQITGSFDRPIIEDALTFSGEVAHLPISGEASGTVEDGMASSGRVWVQASANAPIEDVFSSSGGVRIVGALYGWIDDVAVSDADLVGQGASAGVIEDGLSATARARVQAFVEALIEDRAFAQAGLPVGLRFAFWDGEQFVKYPLKVFVGGQFVEKPLRIFQNGEWRSR